MRVKIVALICLVLACVACTGGSSGSVAHRAGSPTAGSITPSPNGRDGSSRRRTRLPTHLLRDAVHLPGSPRAIVTVGGSLVSLVGPHALPVRWTPRGAVMRGAPIRLGRRAPRALGTSAGQVWVASLRSGSYARLDPRSLRPGPVLHLGAPIRAIVGAADRLWFAEPRAVVRIDPFDGEVVARFPEPDGVERLAASPDGSRLYVALAGPVRHDQVPVVELDGATGAALAKTYAGYAELGGVSDLTATSGGVWITFATGMMGASELARASDLGYHDVEVGRAHGPIVGTNGLAVWVAGGRTWASGGAGGLLCVDPGTGRERAFLVTDRRHPAYVSGGVIGLGGRVYVGMDRSIALVPPARCPSTAQT